MLGSFTLGGSLATNVPLAVVLLSLLGALPALAQAGTVLLVLDEEGHRVVQLLKRPGQPLSLSLAPGRYRVWREQGRQTSQARFTLREGRQPSSPQAPSTGPPSALYATLPTTVSRVAGISWFNN